MGERTGNLFDKDKQAGLIYVTKTVTRYGVEIPVSAGTYSIVGGTNRLFVKEKYGTTYGTPIDTSARRIITLPQNGYILVYSGIEEDYTVSNVMLNTGSTALTYEPYGIKIPISSANTTTPVYLGEVETTRKIKKYVFTGEENWNTDRSTYYTTVSDYYRMYDIGSHLSVCTHYPNLQTLTVAEMHYCLGGLIDGSTQTAWNGNIVFNPSPIITTLSDWKTYLREQYAAGTPVTIWYVLASETTGIVNEPLMKIGDYADTLSMEQAGAEIPTVNGSNILDVDTTVKPSEVYIKYKWR